VKRWNDRCPGRNNRAVTFELASENRVEVRKTVFPQMRLYVEFSLGAEKIRYRYERQESADGKVEFIPAQSFGLSVGTDNEVYLVDGRREIDIGKASERLLAPIFNACVS
jgi:hypothetical protein